MMLEIEDVMNGRNISCNEACSFANKVMGRFRNPFADHRWLGIMVRYSSKMWRKNLPLLLKYFDNHKKVPRHMALGFAAYLAFIKCSRMDDGKYYGGSNGTSYLI